MHGLPLINLVITSLITGFTYNDEGFHVFPGELHLRRLVLRLVQQDVQQVLVALLARRRRRPLYSLVLQRAAAAAAATLHVPGRLLVPDHLLQHGVEPPVDNGGLPAEALEVPAAAQGHVVLEVEGAEQLRHGFHQLLRLVGDGGVARHHPDDGGVGEADELAGDVHGVAPRRRRPHGAEQLRQAAAADVPQLLDGARAQHLGDAQPPEEAPVAAVGREGEAGGAVGEEAGQHRDRPARDGGVVVADQLPGDVGGAGHDAVRGAEADVHQRRPQPRRELVEGAVHRWTQQVEVTDHREARRARGKPARRTSPP